MKHCTKTIDERLTLNKKNNDSNKQQTIDLMWMHAAHESEVDCRVWYSVRAMLESIPSVMTVRRSVCCAMLRWCVFFRDGKVIKSRFNRECLAHTLAHAHTHATHARTSIETTHSSPSLFRMAACSVTNNKCLWNVCLISIHFVLCRAYYCRFFIVLLVLFGLLRYRDVDQMPMKYHRLCYNDRRHRHLCQLSAP